MITLSKNPYNPFVNAKLPKVKDIFARVGYRTISGATKGDISPLEPRKNDVVDELNKAAESAESAPAGDKDE